MTHFEDETVQAVHSLRAAAQVGRRLTLSDGRTAEYRGGPFESVQFTPAPHEINRDCPCDRCDAWYRAHGHGGDIHAHREGQR